MLTEEELRALREGLASAGLRDHVAEAIAGYAVPSLEFSAATSTTVPMGATKIGGRPDLPKETPWPRRSNRVREVAMEPVLGAIPLAFLTQVDLAEAARALPADENPLPASGVLSFFYDAYDQPWGYDPEDRHDFRVIYSGRQKCWHQPRRRRICRRCAALPSARLPSTESRAYPATDRRRSTT